MRNARQTSARVDSGAKASSTKAYFCSKVRWFGEDIVPTSSVNDVVSLKCQRCLDPVPRTVPGQVGMARWARAHHIVDSLNSSHVLHFLGFCIGGWAHGPRVTTMEV